MDDRRFDALTRALARGTSRRTAIKGLFGGVVGGVAVVTHLDRAGAQGGTPCTPGTVLQDCLLPDACTSATCVQGTGTEQYFCAYEGGCAIGSCTVCDNASGECIPVICEPGQECVNGTCEDICPGELYCPATDSCAPQCCDVSDCVAAGDTFCSSLICNAEGYCEVIPECTDGQICCNQGVEGAYCAECCDDDDCGDCAYCNQGVCADWECCEDSDCYDCEVCGEDRTCHPIVCELGYVCCEGNECIREEDCCRGVGDFCGLVEVTSADGSPQLDCCDGLVCCENWNSQGSVCAECCNDWDCPKGAFCHEGWCEYPDFCDHDKDCPKGTCCCKDGTCSGKCCHHHHPKPPKPAPPAPEKPVTTLPATGAGDSKETTGLYGAAALGAAAAFLAAKKLRETPEASAEE